ncbi:MAG: fumarylacetoacetate hydrolase family protein [Bacteroidales bacterium]|nr:fumarylacetoacetate hydrolase family protein [Bacteroidales bacterium]
MKIICVGLNYASHAEEIGMTREKDPVVFMKPDTALLRGNMPFFIPDWAGQFDYEAELVLRISRLGRHVETRFAHRYYDAIGLGIDFTARDLQAKLAAAGQPWEICKSFDYSAAISDFIPVSEFPDVSNIDFSLSLNGELRQHGNSADMINSFDEIVAYVSRFFSLRIGDLIFTGTPPGVGPVKIGDNIVGKIGERTMLDLRVK